jgi:single-stranded DNA-binding protein
MHTAHITLAPLAQSIKQDEYVYHTFCVFNAKDRYTNDQNILLVSSKPIPAKALRLDCIGMLRFGARIDTVQLHASVVTPVLVTPDWGAKHPWTHKEGLTEHHNWITIAADNLGGADSFRSGQTGSGGDVFNCSIASRDHLAILGGNLQAPPAWFKLTFWGEACKKAHNLTPGQSVQFCEGALSFSHWGDNNEMLTVNVSVRTFLQGASSAGIPSRDGEAPPVEAGPDLEAEPSVNLEAIPFVEPASEVQAEPDYTGMPDM